MDGWSKIKEHPVFVVTGCVCAAVMATSFVYEAFVIPLRDPNLERHVAALERKLDLANRAAADLVTAEKRAEAAITRVRDLEERAEQDRRRFRSDLVLAYGRSDAVIWAHSFVKGTPYPVEIDRLKVSESVDGIKQFYPVYDLEWNDFGAVTVKTGHPVFDLVTYYFRPDRKITHIFFRSAELRRRGSSRWAIERLTAVIGPPTKVSKEKFGDYASWTPVGTEGVFAKAHEFLIMEEGVRPLAWPD